MYIVCLQVALTCFLLPVLPAVSVCLCCCLRVCVCVCAATDCCCRYSLTFLSASDEGVFDDHVYNARLDKEAGSLAHWQRVAAGLQNLAAFHDWLYSDHLCYAVPRQKEFGKRTIQDQRLLESY